MNRLGSGNIRNGTGRSRRRLGFWAAARGFTLIELLVVVAILGLLLAILSPVVTKARDAAKFSGCSVNLRALQTGMTLYAANSGMGVSGMEWDGGNSWVDDLHWEIWWGERGRRNIKFGLIWPYVKNYGPYLCPTFEQVCRQPPAGAECRPGVLYGKGYTGWGGTVPAFDPATFEPVRSYSLSEYIGRNKKSLFTLDMSERVWLCDENPWRQLYLQDDLGGWVSAYGINNGHLGWEADTPAEYHDGKTNCVFGDGHVEPWTPMAVHLNLAD